MTRSDDLIASSHSGSSASMFTRFVRQREGSMNHPLLIRTAMDRKWVLPLLFSFAISLILFAVSTFLLMASSHRATASILAFIPFPNRSRASESGVIKPKEIDGINAIPSYGLPALPKLAYAISGSKGDGKRMRRTLQALYHPRNQYVLHLDLESSTRERVDLSRYVRAQPMFVSAANVHMISKANLVTYKGPTMIACTLHAAAILLKKSKDWDWFINLSASDYPLVTQDDLLHLLSYVPRDLNFLDHTSKLGWKENGRARPMIIDPALYSSTKTDLFWVTQTRPLPASFRLFTGSAWMILTRAFLEHCIWGWDNLPRILLMYYTNFLSSPEGYFHTIICNTKEFKNTTVNHDMHFIAWDKPPKQHPLSLNMEFFPKIVDSGVPFARKFNKDDPILDKIDAELLGRKRGFFTPGAWCSGTDEDGKDPCLVNNDINIVKPGPGAKRLEQLLLKLLSDKFFRQHQCRVD